MTNRPNVNRKLRAKQGSEKWRKEFGKFYPRENANKAMLRQATGQRILLERERERYASGLHTRRFEEDEARALFVRLNADEFNFAVPSVHAIMREMKEGKWQFITAQL